MGFLERGKMKRTVFHFILTFAIILILTTHAPKTFADVEWSGEVIPYDPTTCGMLPKNCTIKSESIVDEFGILLTLNLGDCTHEEAF